MMLELEQHNMLKEFKRKYGKIENGEIFIDLPINREDMANYCGITRETMSRKLSIFEHEGLIEIRGNKSLIIKDIERLNKIISQETLIPMKLFYFQKKFYLKVYFFITPSYLNEGTQAFELVPLSCINAFLTPKDAA